MRQLLRATGRAHELILVNPGKSRIRPDRAELSCSGLLASGSLAAVNRAPKLLLWRQHPFPTRVPGG
jgi:hypothetical protein